jgi:hypothetical protein
MPAWLKMANIAWFRMALVNEPSGEKRRALEEKLAAVEAEVKTALFEPPAAQA